MSFEYKIITPPVTVLDDLLYHAHHHSRPPSGEELCTLDHCHTFSSSEEVAARRQKTADSARRKLLVAVVLTVFFVIGEVVGGYLSQSLVIMTDAAHMLSDLGSFIVGLLAIRLGRRAGSRRYTFGFHRAEALGALCTVIIIWYVTGVLLYLASHRISTGDFEVEPIPMMVVAGSAVVFNIVLGVVLHGVPHAHGHSHGGGSSHSHGNNNQEGGGKAEEHLNVRAAAIHVLGDLIQSIGVLISSVIIKLNPELKLADPICTIIFSVIVFCTTVNVVRDSVHILMEGSPRSVNYDDVLFDLMNVPDVVLVHDLRMWSLTTDKNALNVHLAVNSTSASTSERVLQRATKLLREKHGFYSTTIQTEEYKAAVMNACDQCQPVV